MIAHGLFEPFVKIGRQYVFDVWIVHVVFGDEGNAGVDALFNGLIFEVATMVLTPR